MSRLSRNYLGLTFLIMLICWGTCFLCSLAGISLENNKLLYLPYLLGGLSPTIASYLALRRSGGTANLKEWLKSIFDFKHNIFSYHPPATGVEHPPLPWFNKMLAPVKPPTKKSGRKTRPP